MEFFTYGFFPFFSHFKDRLFLKVFLAYFIFSQFGLHAISTLMLKNGTSLRGTIKEQNETAITFQTLDGSVSTLKKSDILKIQYKDPKPTEETPSVEVKPKEEPKAVLVNSPSSEEAKGKYAIKKPSAFISYEITEAYETAELSLALPTDICQEYNRSSDWFWLFGTLPLSRPNLAEILPKDKKRIRIRSVATGMDATISFFGAIMTSITRKTIIVDVCEKDPAQTAGAEKPAKKK